MRDKRFIAVHRGGFLTPEHHRMIIKWACDCAEHLLHVTGISDYVLLKAVETGRAWAEGYVKTGQARESALEAINAAHDAADEVSVAVARAVGHGVATAHMADHCAGVVLYGLRAVKLSGKNVETEREWQIARIPEQVRDQITELLSEKEKHFRI